MHGCSHRDGPSSEKYSFSKDSYRTRYPLNTMLCHGASICSMVVKSRFDYSQTKLPFHWPAPKDSPGGSERCQTKAQFSTAANIKKREGKTSTAWEMNKESEQIAGDGKENTTAWKHAASLRRTENSDYIKTSLSTIKWARMVCNRLQGEDKGTDPPDEGKLMQTEGSLATSPHLIPPNTFTPVNPHQEIPSTNILVDTQFPAVYWNKEKAEILSARTGVYDVL